MIERIGDGRAEGQLIAGETESHPLPMHYLDIIKLLPPDKQEECTRIYAALEGESGYSDLVTVALWMQEVFMGKKNQFVGKAIVVDFPRDQLWSEEEQVIAQNWHIQALLSKILDSALQRKDLGVVFSIFQHIDDENQLVNRHGGVTADAVRHAGELFQNTFDAIKDDPGMWEAGDLNNNNWHVTYALGPALKSWQQADGISVPPEWSRNMAAEMMEKIRALPESPHRTMMMANAAEAIAEAFIFDERLLKPLGLDDVARVKVSCPRQDGKGDVDCLTVIFSRSIDGGASWCRNTNMPFQYAFKEAMLEPDSEMTTERAIIAGHAFRRMQESIKHKPNQAMLWALEEINALGNDPEVRAALQKAAQGTSPYNRQYSTEIRQTGRYLNLDHE